MKLRSNGKIGWMLILSIALAVGCDRDDPPAPAATPRTNVPSSPPATTQQSNRVRVVFLGDSITAGFGLDADQAFPSLVERKLKDEGLPVEVVNAGVSGDTTAGGLRRLDWLLRQKPDVLVVGLGGNDGLRALELKASEENLRQIVRKSREAGAEVLLLGMMIPPNYGPEYAGAFKELYPRVAQETGAALVPFVLEGVGGEAKFNLPDGIHPNAEGHRIVAENVAGQVRELVKKRQPLSAG